MLCLHSLLPPHLLQRGLGSRIQGSRILGSRILGSRILGSRILCRRALPPGTFVSKTGGTLTSMQATVKIMEGFAIFRMDIGIYVGILVWLLSESLV